jgi:hypothetical protein
MSLLALAGCSAGAGESSSSSPTPSATAESSTIEQWASLIAIQQAEWDDWFASWEQSRCSSTTAAMPDGIDCRIQLTSAVFMV